MLYLDANVILRYLLEDCEKFIEQSKVYIENYYVYIKNEVLKDVSNLAFEIFEIKNIDFVDALLCSYSKILKYEVVSFDKKLNKYIGTTE